MADEDFYVFELGGKIQLKLTRLQLLFLLSGDFLGCPINIFLCQTKIKWRVPYDGLIIRGNGLLGVKSAGKEEAVEESGSSYLISDVLPHNREQLFVKCWKF